MKIFQKRYKLRNDKIDELVCRNEKLEDKLGYSDRKIREAIIILNELSD